MAETNPNTQAAISAGTDLAVAGANMYAQMEMNEDNIEFAREQSNLAWQRQQNMWSRTNEYNSPTNQMARFEAAGLNKHLIYGKGTPGNASQSGTPQMAKYNKVLPRIKVNAASAIMAYNDTRMKNAQIDNLKQIRRNLEQDETQKKLSNYLKGVHAQYAPYLEKLSATAKTEMLRQRRANIEKIMQETIRLKQTTDFEKYKQDFVKDNEYTPDAPPSLWKGLFELKKYLQGIPISDIIDFIQSKQQLNPMFK